MKLANRPTAQCGRMLGTAVADGQLIADAARDAGQQDHEGICGRQEIGNRVAGETSGATASGIVDLAYLVANIRSNRHEKMPAQYHCYQLSDYWPETINPTDPSKA